MAVLLWLNNGVVRSEDRRRYLRAYKTTTRGMNDLVTPCLPLFLSLSCDLSEQRLALFFEL